MEWNWWVCQGLALIGLVFIIISMQQKTAIKLLWYRFVALCFINIGLCFLGDISAIILGASGTVQVVIALIFAYYPKTKPTVKWTAIALLAVSIVILNIIFWFGYLNILAIAYGAVGLVAFMQKRPAAMRLTVIPACILGMVYFSLLLAPINAAIDGIVLISTVVGIIRLDTKRKQK